MIQMHMQQGLSQDARIIRQEVFVEEQGFHHEFDETDQTAWHLVLYENGHAAGCCRHRSGCARFMKNWDIPHRVMNIWMNIVLISTWKRS